MSGLDYDQQKRSLELYIVGDYYPNQHVKKVELQYQPN